MKTKKRKKCAEISNSGVIGFNYCDFILFYFILLQQYGRKMAVSSLKERLTKLQSKTKKGRLNSSSLSQVKEKKSIFSTISQETLDTNIDVNSDKFFLCTNHNGIPKLTIPDVDFNDDRIVSKETLIIVIKSLSKSYLFPQIGSGSGMGLLSQNSKTSRISRQYPKVCLQDQLYALFRGQETHIDKCINELVSIGKIRILDMNFENFGFNVLILAEEFEKILENSFKESEYGKLIKFKEIFDIDPTATQISNAALLRENLQISTFINKGLICISASDSIPGIYNITLPHLGGLLRVIKNAVKWITDTTEKTREKMILATELRDKWTKPFLTKSSKQQEPTFKREYYTSNRVGTSNGKLITPTGPGVNIVKFRGVGLDWILAMMIGIGILESYDSPVGLIYKATGKRL